VGLDQPSFKIRNILLYLKLKYIFILRIILRIILGMVNCKYLECNNRILKIIGNCKACDKTFCSKHRYPEEHNCPRLLEIRLKSKRELINKLHNDSIQENKVMKI
jgi:hypothetical protein